MATRKRSDVKDLRGAGKLIVDATTNVADVVERMHRVIGSGPKVLGAPLEKPMTLFTQVVYGSIRGVTKLVGKGVDLALAQLEPLLSDREAGPGRESALAALNGVLGDVLQETGNPLAISMQLRRGGKPLALNDGHLGGRVVVLVHGSSMNDLQWARLGHHHGEALERDLGFTSIALHYNSGLHISTTGAQFAELLESTFAQWPVPLEELVLIGHSMGGLVARSACHVGAKHAWRRKVQALVTLGTPHHGAPLERGGAWAEFLLGLFPQSAPLKHLAHVRSAGVTDLRYGNVRDEDWQGRDRFSSRTDTRTPTSLPKGVECFAVAATMSKTHVKRLLGDGLVPVDSALGRHADPARALAFSQTLLTWGAGHLDLLSRSEVYEALRGWLTSSHRPRS